MEFSDWIKDRRKQLGLTLDDVATTVGVSKTTVMRWETGDIKNMRRDRIDALSRVLQCSNRDIINFQDSISTFEHQNAVKVPVIASICAGYGGVAEEDQQGFEYVYDAKNPGQLVWFKVTGDSMLPDIKDGDLALVRRQFDVKNGDIAVVIYDGELGTIKRIQFHENAVSLVPLNPNFQTKVIIGTQRKNLIVYGKVIEIKRKF